MPIDAQRYPKNWKELALSVKEAAGWRCECCGKQCYRPGEPKNLSRAEWSADILQVHHRDFNCSNNCSNNLIALCSACHLNAHRSSYSPVSPGQLSLF